MDEPCRCFEDIEKALVKIAKKRRFLVYDLQDALLWCTPFSLDEPSPKYSAILCALPKGIQELADKVDPPKPKKREWRVGDEVQYLGKDRFVITGFASQKSAGAKNLMFESLAIGRIGGYNTNIYHHWHNLTIEAEMEAEK